MSGVLMAAAGCQAAAGAGGTEFITLSGTTGAPNEAGDSAIDPADARAGWYFRTDGTVDRFSNGVLTQFQAGSEWSNFQPTPGTDYWIRATLNNGTAPNIGSSLTTWHRLSGTGEADRDWQWEQTTIGQFLTDSVKVEISTDSGGSTIVATGYYGISDVLVEP